MTAGTMWDAAEWDRFERELEGDAEFERGRWCAECGLALFGDEGCTFFCYWCSMTNGGSNQWYG